MILRAPLSGWAGCSLRKDSARWGGLRLKSSLCSPGPALGLRAALTQNKVYNFLILIIVPQWLITAWICIALQFYLKISCFCLFCFFVLQKISVASRWFLCVCIHVVVVVQLPSHVQLFVTPWSAAHQASVFLTISWSLPKLMFIASVMPSSHRILWCPLLLLPSIFPSIRGFSNESAVCIRWSKYWSFNFSISPSNEYSGLISLETDWFDLLVLQGTDSQESSPAPQFESINKHQFSSIQSLSHIWLFVTPWTAACQASLSITNSRSLSKLMSIESVMPSNHLIICHPLLLLPSIFPSIRVFSNESVLRIRWPK